MHFFVQFPSELQLIVAQLHFPKLVKMVNLYLFVFVYFKIRASKFVLNQSRAVGTQFLRLILAEFISETENRLGREIRL